MDPNPSSVLFLNSFWPPELLEPIPTTVRQRWDTPGWSSDPSKDRYLYKSVLLTVTLERKNRKGAELKFFCCTQHVSEVCQEACMTWLTMLAVMLKVLAMTC